MKTAVLLGLVCAAGQVTTAPEPRVLAISGVVRDADERAVAGASVLLLRERGGARLDIELE